MTNQTLAILDALKAKPEIYQEIREHFWSLKPEHRDIEPKHTYHMCSQRNVQGYFIHIKDETDALHMAIIPDYEHNPQRLRIQTGKSEFVIADDFDQSQNIQSFLDPYDLSVYDIIMPWKLLPGMTENKEYKNLWVRCTLSKPERTTVMYDPTFQQWRMPATEWTPTNTNVNWHATRIIDEELHAQGLLLLG